MTPGLDSCNVVSMTHEFSTRRDWDPANTLTVDPTFALWRSPNVQPGDGVVIHLATLRDDRAGTYIGHVQDVDDFTFTVELM